MQPAQLFDWPQAGDVTTIALGDTPDEALQDVAFSAAFAQCLLTGGAFPDRVERLASEKAVDFAADISKWHVTIRISRAIAVPGEGPGPVWVEPALWAWETGETLGREFTPLIEHVASLVGIVVGTEMIGKRLFRPARVLRVADRPAVYLPWPEVGAPSLRVGRPLDQLDVGTLDRLLARLTLEGPPNWFRNVHPLLWESSRSEDPFRRWVFTWLSLEVFINAYFDVVSTGRSEMQTVDGAWQVKYLNPVDRRFGALAVLLSPDTAADVAPVSELRDRYMRLAFSSGHDRS